ncbi:MAG TPA: rhomboid family intramembrane serine protease [Candidatus Aenigmarchaeota archaeon]|nr:rhomboid family intramembrane serine protease [Candidatus Aenigmarchaeota archaeon]
MYRNYSLTLVGICIIVFILQVIFPDITDQFALYSNRVVAEPWLLVTSMFLHGSFPHLFFNMFALALFGSILEHHVGAKRFLVIYFISGIVAGIASAFFYPASLGASGAIYGILGTLAVLRPRMIVWVMGIPMPMYAAAVVWATIDLIGMFAPSGIANAAHLAGLGAGIIAGFVLKGGIRLPKRKKDSDPLTEEERRRIEEYFDRLEELYR